MNRGDNNEWQFKTDIEGTSELNGGCINNDDLSERSGPLLDRSSLPRIIGRWLDESKTNEIIVLLILEIKEFHKIKGVLNSDARDVMISLVAKRLFSLHGYTFSLAKLDSDELGIAIRGLEEIESVWEITKWIEKQFQKPFRTNKVDIYLSPKIGFSAIPFIVADQHSLMKTAYWALNKAKDNPNISTYMYEAKYASDIHNKLVIESDLHIAIKNGDELQVYYQPKQALKTGKYIGFEALVRWEHPLKGVIYPNEFIPVAEDTGLICGITRYVLSQVCIDLPELITRGFVGNISVNISAKDLARRNFASEVSDLVQQYNINANYIEFEITESTLIKDFAQSYIALSILREKGFTFSIDDFGTGYCSFSYLQKLPIDILKVDISLVRNIEKSDEVKGVFSALLQLASALDLKVVAEGVENFEQKKVLNAIGCNYIQGYLLSEPIPITQISRFL